MYRYVVLVILVALGCPALAEEQGLRIPVKKVLELRNGDLKAVLHSVVFLRDATVCNIEIENLNLPWAEVRFDHPKGRTPCYAYQQGEKIRVVDVVSSLPYDRATKSFFHKLKMGETAQVQLVFPPLAFAPFDLRGGRQRTTHDGSIEFWNIDPLSLLHHREFDRKKEALKLKTELSQAHTSVGTLQKELDTARTDLTQAQQQTQQLQRQKRRLQQTIADQKVQLKRERTTPLTLKEYFRAIEQDFKREFAKFQQHQSSRTQSSQKDAADFYRNVETYFAQMRQAKEELSQAQEELKSAQFSIQEKDGQLRDLELQLDVSNGRLSDYQTWSSAGGVSLLCLLGFCAFGMVRMRNSQSQMRLLQSHSESSYEEKESEVRELRQQLTLLEAATQGNDRSLKDVEEIRHLQERVLELEQEIAMLHEVYETGRDEDAKQEQHHLQLQDRQLRLEELRLSTAREKSAKEQQRLLEKQAHSQRMAEKEQEITLQKAQAERALFERLQEFAQLPLEKFLAFFAQKLEQVTEAEFQGKNHTGLLELYLNLKKSFERNGLISLERLEEVTPDVQRINQIETIMDLYGEKIRKVKQDGLLDDEEQLMKVEYWIRLRDKDIQELEGVG
ncbi:hypothetical protein APED_01360 [Acanthopleuribacter pedis]